MPACPFTLIILISSINSVCSVSFAVLFLRPSKPLSLVTSLKLQLLVFDVQCFLWAAAPLSLTPSDELTALLLLFRRPSFGDFARVGGSWPYMLTLSLTQVEEHNLIIMCCFYDTVDETCFETLTWTTHYLHCIDWTSYMILL